MYSKLGGCGLLCWFVLFGSAQILGQGVPAGGMLTPTVQKDRSLNLRAWSIPSGSFLTSDPEKESGELETLPGVKRINQSAPQDGSFPPLWRDEQFDVREKIKALGIELSAESETIYDRRSCTLVVRAPTEEIDLIDMVLSSTCETPFFSGCLRITFQVADFTVENAAGIQSDLIYTELRKKAGASWHELQSFTLVSRSGQRTEASNIAGAVSHHPVLPSSATAKGESPVPAFAPLEPGEVGIKAEVEPQLGPDGRTIDLSFKYSLRIQGEEPVCSIDSTVTTWEGYPVILQMIDAPKSAAASEKGRSMRAVIMSVQLFNPGGWPLSAPKEKR